MIFARVGVVAASHLGTGIAVACLPIEKFSPAIPIVNLGVKFVFNM
jgi:hypothetical protein